jgi:hypothetical protein
MEKPIPFCVMLFFRQGDRGNFSILCKKRFASCWWLFTHRLTEVEKQPRRQVFLLLGNADVEGYNICLKLNTVW